MAGLFSPLTIRSVTIPNRIAVSPMCQYSAIDGFANNWHLVHLGSRAVGGAGLVIVEATGVSPEGRITPGCLGLWKDEQITPLKNIADFIHQQGSIAGIQLAHAGRKASCSVPWLGGKQLALADGGWETIAPSPLPFYPTDRVPQELTKPEISELASQFAEAARRALTAGFNLVEIHAAHGYLLHEFLSPLSNIRTDEYGGSFENRIRFLLEVTEMVRSVWPEELPLFVRVSATDWVEGGWTENDTVRLAAILKTKGVDLLDCSTGGNSSGVKIPLEPGYQVQFASAARQSGILTGAVGLITTARQANDLIRQEKADLVLMAREFLRNPYFPMQAARELEAEIKWPDQYVRAKK